MIHINFTEPEDKDWKDWKVKCAKETKKLIKRFQNGQELKISKTLYKEQKPVFFNLEDNFYGKCAYCESLITNTHPGDVEHFRPKGAVTDLKNKPIIITIDGQKRPHPGYYWLAYEWTNLLPSCIDCNRLSSGNSQGKVIGKGKKFPLKNKYAIEPGDETDEEPLLINPRSEDPAKYLVIDKFGLLHPYEESERGHMCIKVFGLNDRPTLIDERKRMYETAADDYALAWISVYARSANLQKRIKKIEEYKKGKRPYSIAAIKAIKDVKREFDASGKPL